MTVGTPDLPLPLVNPAEVAPRVLEAQHEEPRLLASTRDIDVHLEEIDLGQFARAIRQRNQRLPPLPLPLGHRRLDQRHADGVAFRLEQLVQSRGGQPCVGVATAAPPRAAS